MKTPDAGANQQFDPLHHMVFGRIGGNRISLPWYGRALWVSILLLALLAALATLSLCTGRDMFSLAELWAALGDPGGRGQAKILWDLRMPRVVSGLCVGAGLAVAGAVFQSISRNALGSPEIIGLTSGAAAGAVISIVLLGTRNWGTSAGALVGCLIASALTYLLSYRGGATGGYRLVLVGIGIGAILQAVTTLVLVRTDPNVAIAGQIWLVGTLNARTWDVTVTMVVVSAVLIPAVLFIARFLNTLELGDAMATMLGVRTELARIVGLVLAVGLTAAAVATCGPISFVALAAPHLTRSLLRTATVPVLPAALLGGCLLIAADLLGQHLPSGFSAPVGVTAGVLGGGYLIWILTRRRYVL